MQLKWDIFNLDSIKRNLSCGLFFFLVCCLCFVLFLWYFYVDFILFFLLFILSNLSTGLSACIQKWELLFSYAAGE